MRFRIVICILLAAFAVAPQTGLAADSSTPVSLEEFLKRLGYGSVPFKSDAHNRLRVDADLGNGKKRILFVDTGWHVTMLNEKSARGLKTLGELGVDLKDPYLGQVTNSSFVLVEKLILGRAQFANQPARVGKLRMDYTQLPFDGVLGVDFLLRNFCLIDLSARRLYFRGSEPSPDQAKVIAESLRLSGFVEIPMRLDHALTVPAEIKGEPVQLIVDTGSTYTVIDRTLSRRLALTPIKAGTDSGALGVAHDLEAYVTGMNDIGTHKAWITKLSTLQVGSRTWTNTFALVTNLKPWDPENVMQLGEGIHGTLGFDLLGEGHALIDFAQGKLWLRASSKPGRS